ncbi:MAG: hypothetical protein B7Z37_12255 [Verrucomicrobia bacterium 12-59-8]|nr:MAG: hypothetical protein B7Z37_12255 [Verrucomicrobia bacterium 12-59-8]
MKFRQIVHSAASLLVRAWRRLWSWLVWVAKFAVRKFIQLLRRLHRRALGEKPKPSPLGMILHDPTANIDLHLFLLGNPDKNQPTPITVDGRTFEVGIVSINPAPVLNTLQRTTTG